MRTASDRVWIGLLAAFALGAANWWMYRVPFPLVAPWIAIMLLAGVEMFILTLAVREWDLAVFGPLALWAGLLAVTIGFGIITGYVSGPYYWGSTIEFAADMLVIQLAPAYVGAVLGMALIATINWRLPS